MGPNWRDWLLLVISAAFVAAGGLLVVARPRESIGWLCLVFFGGCLAVAVATLVRKRRAARQWRDPNLAVHIVGGQEIAVDSRRMAWSSLSLIAFAGFAIAFGGNLGTGFIAACAALGLLAAVALAALALGYTGRSSLCFEPEALWVRTGRLRYPVLWDNIATVDLVEAHEHPWLRIRVHDLGALLSAVEPASAVKTAARGFGHNRGLLGADIALLPRLFAVDEVVLLQAIARYASDRQARAELGPRAELGGASDG